MIGDCEIGVASQVDVDGILRLQESNLPYNRGTLSVRFARGWFEATIQAMPIIVARRAGLIGYLVSSSIEAHAEVPIVRAMLEAHPGGAGAYVYGPICVAASARRQGIAGLMFKALREQLPGQEGILFIRRDNEPSLRAHKRMGINEVAEFEFNGTTYAVLSYVG